ncbi:MAG: hypothetical protein LUD02_13790 [Tannerellaceae bacterium]|nr:hypothetical protein [Tannerellaceae bacterium]
MLALVGLYFLYRRKIDLKEGELLKSRELIRKHKAKMLENEFIIAQNLEQLSEKELQLVENQQKILENEKLICQNRKLQQEIEKCEEAYHQYVENSRNSFLKENEELMVRYERLKRREEQLMDKLIRNHRLLCYVKESGKKRISLDKGELDGVVDSVNDIYDSFANRLGMSYSQLTVDDILVCCLLKLKLKSTEIAALTDSMPDAIYKRKQRIKECIGDMGYNSLDEFIYMF